jgi:hypothetical protein
MTYEGIEYAIRAGLGRNDWVLLISFPDSIGSNPSVVPRGTITLTGTHASSVFFGDAVCSNRKVRRQRT